MRHSLNQWPAYLGHNIDSIILRQIPIENLYALAAIYFALVGLLVGLMVWAVWQLPDDFVVDGTSEPAYGRMA